MIKKDFIVEEEVRGIIEEYVYIVLEIFDSLGRKDLVSVGYRFKEMVNCVL